MSVCIPKWNNNICVCGGWHICVHSGMCVALRRQPWLLILGFHIVKRRFSIALYAFQVSRPSSFKLEILISRFNIGVLEFQNHTTLSIGYRYMFASVSGDLKKESDPLELCYSFEQPRVSTGNRTQVLSKNDKCPSPLSHPSDPVCFYFELSYSTSKLHTCTEFSIRIFISIFLTTGNVSSLSILNDNKP